MKTIKEVPAIPVLRVAVRRMLLASAVGVGVGVSTGHVGGCGSSSNPDSKCDDCLDIGEAVWLCTTGANIYKGTVCMPANSIGTDVIIECNSTYVGFSWKDPPLWPCEGMADGASDSAGGDQTCTGWNPGSHVTLVGSVRHVDRAFIDDLVDDPFPLVECDTARFQPETSGVGYKVVSAASTSLVYKLGFRTNDIILKVNNQTLNTLDEAALRLTGMYLYGSTASYAIQYKRGGVTQTLNFVVDS